MNHLGGGAQLSAPLMPTSFNVKASAARPAGLFGLRKNNVWTYGSTS